MKRGGHDEGHPEMAGAALHASISVSGFPRLNPIELQRDEKHMRHITGAWLSQRHQWRPLFYRQSLGRSLCCSPYGLLSTLKRVFD